MEANSLMRSHDIEQIEPSKYMAWKEEKDVARALQDLPDYFFRTRKGLSTRGVRGAPRWLGYEDDIWQLSEKVRQYLRSHKKLRGKNLILDEVERLVIEKRYGKGRQNFLLILGDYGRGAYGETLGALLDDPEVYGHATKALAKARIDGYRAKVESLLEKERVSWIRSAAKTYLERTGN